MKIQEIFPGLHQHLSWMRHINLPSGKMSMAISVYPVESNYGFMGTLNRIYKSIVDTIQKNGLNTLILQPLM